MSAAITDSNPPGQFYCPTCEKNFEIGDRCPTDGTRLVRINVPVDPLLGRELDGRYMVLQKLGQGGMGAVYRGSQLGLGREVAIKVVSAHLVTEPDVVKRFLREAKLASRLTHPNAVAVLDFNQTDDGLFYLVMELVSGRTLDKVFEGEHALRPERVVRIGMQVCDALEGAHSLQIVHRDLKPSNIMILDRGRDLVKVLDFGLAKSVAPDQTTTTMTNAGALLGTPAFMPHELALGEPCDGRADLYSLGVVLYLLGSGKLPFISDSAHELIAMHASEVAPPMVGVPAALANVIDRMLRKDPAERYQSATENREALENALDAMRIKTPPAGVPVIDGPSIATGVRVPAQITPVPHDTPVPHSLIDARRRAQSPSAMHALAVGETLAPGSHSGLTPVPPVAPAKKRWVIPAAVAGVLVAAGLGFVAFNGASTKQPATGSAASDPGSATEIKASATPPPADSATLTTTGSAATGSAAAGSAAIDHATTDSVLAGSAASVPKTKPGAKHHTTVPHTVDKTVPHTVETTPKPEPPKAPDPGKSGGSALPF
ncbi:MAG TPA: serine/threonine-protein kinase [Kofleriaceae bacterium]|nr:serine/threonine-protein kinase [Kofleriaceae bacterium]